MIHATGTTRTAKAPSPDTATRRWVCVAIRPATGLPRDPDGHLQLRYDWQLRSPERVIPEEPQPAIRRGLAHHETGRGRPQRDLFG